MQGEIPHLPFMGAKNGLQATINALAGQHHPGQRPAHLVNVEGVDDSAPGAQQRAWRKGQPWLGQTPGQHSGQPDIEDEIVLLGNAGELQRHGAVIHAQLAGAKGEYRVAFPGIALSQNVHSPTDDGVLRALLPVVDLQPQAAAKGNTGLVPVPASVADGQLFRGDLPGKI